MRRSSIDRKEAVRRAAEAHTNLNTFGTIQTIVEGGHLYRVGSTAANRINKICEDEMQKQLRLYDRYCQIAGRL